MRKPRLLSLTLLVGLLPASGAWADKPAPAAPPVENLPETAARAHYQAGRVYFEQKDYQRALVEFQAAARDLPLPAIDFNIARAYDRLGDAARAVDLYGRYLDRSPMAEDRGEVASRMIELQNQVGTLVVASKVAGAVITLDDAPLAPDQVNRAISLTAGRHMLVASKEGYLSHRVEVRIVPRQPTIVEVDPQPPVVTTVERVVLRDAPKKGVWKSAVAGAAVGVVVVGAVALVLALTLGGTVADEPYAGNLSPFVQKFTP